MKRLLWAMLLCLPGWAGAQGQSVPPYPGAYDEEGPSLEQIQSIPYTYVGGSGRISLTMDNEGNSTGEMLRIFDNTGEHAWIGQLWWGHGGAGGVQIGYNWLWGGMSLSQARENPGSVSVARTLLAIDQNAFKDRKMTLGFGIERPSYFVDAYLSAAASGSRDGGARLHALENLLSGTDDVGSYTQLETTTLIEEFATAAYDYGIGLRFGRNSSRHALRIYGGLDYQDGDGGAHILTISAGADKHLGRRGWSLSGLVEHDQSSTDPLLGTSSDTRATLALRYEFGGRIFVPSSEAVAPAWISRAMVSPPTSRPRVVQTYTRRTRTTTTTELAPRQYTNHHPVGVDDMVSVVEGSDAIWIDALANDSDADGDALTLVAVTPPAHGTASISDNRIRYAPAAGFSGSDPFSYTMSDGRGGSGSATVHVTVAARPNQVPIANNDSVITPFDTPITFAPLDNDSDPDGDALHIVSITQPPNGSATLSGGQITYTPRAGFSGMDTLSYTIEDGRGGSASAQISVTVLSSANGLPIAVSDDASVEYSQSVDIDVRANDSDPDGDLLTVVSVTQGAYGSVTILADGRVRYTWDIPLAGGGADSFNYTISDGRGGTATATVLLTLAVTPGGNTAPIALDDYADAELFQSVEIDVLANDSDPDGDLLTVISAGQPNAGYVEILPDGRLRYTWDIAGAGGGSDRFSYTISDGRGGTASATVYITRIAPNRMPIAVDDTVLNPVALGASIDIDVRGNDSDPDLDVLTVIAVTNGIHGGTVQILGTGNVLYTAPATMPPGGSDEFSYTISDGRGGEATARVFVPLATPFNQNPIAQNLSMDVFHNIPSAIDVLSSATDPDVLDVLTVIAVTNGTYGTATILANGDVQYFWSVPLPAGLPAQDQFTYTISDGNGGTDTATVTVTRLNRAPMVVDDTDSIPTPTSSILLLEVLDNDQELDEDDMTIIQVNGTLLYGTVDINSDLRSLTYTRTVFTPPPTTNEVFTYTVSDGRGGVATATVTLFP